MPDAYLVLSHLNATVLVEKYCHYNDKRWPRYRRFNFQSCFGLKLRICSRLVGMQLFDTSQFVGIFFLPNDSFQEKIKKFCLDWRYLQSTHHLYDELWKTKFWAKLLKHATFWCYIFTIQLIFQISIEARSLLTRKDKSCFIYLFLVCAS